MSVKQTKIAKIRPSAMNPRKAFDEEQLNELAESIRKHGVLQAPIVREITPEVNGFDDASGAANVVEYELVVGERRWRAAKLAGLKMIPVSIRTLSDQEVAEMQIIENNQRADVTPLEEADALAGLGKWLPVEEIAAKLGRPEAFVRRRLLLTKLVPELRELLESDRIGVVSAETLGRLSEELQHELAAGELNRDQRFYDEVLKTWNTREVQSIIQRSTRRLDAAPWKDLDALIGEHPACNGCPHRSIAQPDLFEGYAQSLDNCLNKPCWDAKTRAYVESLELPLVEGDWNFDDFHSPWTTVYDEEGARIRLEEVPEAEAAKCVVTFRDGHIGEMYDRSKLEEIIAGKYELKPKNNDKAERERKKHEAEAWAARIDAIVEAASAMSWEELAPWIARGVVEDANVDVQTALVKRRKIPMVEAKYSPGRDTIIKYVGEVLQNEAELRRLMVELLIRPRPWWNGPGIFEEFEEHLGLATTKEAA